MGKGPGTSPPVPPFHLGISNIMATLDVGCPIDLVKFYCCVRNTEYSPKMFQALIWRQLKPRITCNIFKTGKMVVNGAKTFEESRIGAAKAYKVLKKIGVPVTKAKYDIANIVCYGALGSPFNLDVFHEARIPGLFTEFLPEIFPGMTIRFDGTNTILKVFASGKFYFTGAKTTAEPLALFRVVYPVLKGFCRYHIPDYPSAKPPSAEPPSSSPPSAKPTAKRRKVDFGDDPKDATTSLIDDMHTRTLKEQIKHLR